jgi:hypothetical protein
MARLDGLEHNVSLVGLEPRPYWRCFRCTTMNDKSTAEIADWTRETPQQFWDPGRTPIPTLSILANALEQIALSFNGLLSGCEGGDHVDTGAGAKILGSVSIGDHGRISANAVIVRDVEPGAVVIRINTGPQSTGNPIIFGLVILAPGISALRLAKRDKKQRFQNHP